MLIRVSRSDTFDLLQQNFVIPEDYAGLLAEVKERIRSAQYDALRAVNKELVALYWDLGRVICKRQADGTSWGKAIVERLAADLRAEFPGIQGFSSQNLWYMRRFYLAYHGHEKLQPLVGKISWAKHLVILGKCKDPLEREFYIRMTKKFGWTKNVLIHQIENESYEKTLLGQTNFDKALTPKLRAQAKLAVRNEQVCRNTDRFPPDFAFILTDQEVTNLRSRFVTSR